MTPYLKTYLQMLRENYISIRSLKLDKITAITKGNPRELTLGKALCAIIKCLKSLSTDTSWNNVKAVQRQQFHLVLTVTS